MTSADDRRCANRGHASLSRGAPPSPHALMLCSLDILPDACTGIEFNHAFVEIIGKARLSEQRLRGRQIADDFEMPESVSDPINRGAILKKRLDSFRRGEDRHSVEEN